MIQTELPFVDMLTMDLCSSPINYGSLLDCREDFDHLCSLTLVFVHFVHSVYLGFVSIYLHLYLHLYFLTFKINQQQPTIQVYQKPR